MFTAFGSLKDQLVKEIQEEYDKFYPIINYSLDKKYSDLNHNLLKRLENFILSNVSNVDSKIISMASFGLHLIISDNKDTCLLYIPSYIFEQKYGASYKKIENIEFNERDIIITKV